MTPVDLILGRLKDARPLPSGGYLARCPGHDDSNPSLSVGVGSDGRVLLHCFSGCSHDAIVRGLGLEDKDLFQRPTRTRGREVARWTIQDVKGEAVAIHVRIEPGPKGESKSCIWLRPDGSRGLGGIKVADLPLYGAERVSGLVSDSTIVVVEGEKCADALLGLGLAAVGTVTGAGSTPSTSTLEILRGHRVILWPDADDPGRQHMSRVANCLRGVAIEVLSVRPPDDAPPGWDVADLVSDRARAGDTPEKTREAVLHYISGAQPPVPPTAPLPLPPGPAPNRERFTDVGNAERIHARHGKDLRYCHPWGKWLAWDSRRWAVDTSGEIDRRAVDTARSIYDEVPLAPDVKTAAELARHAFRSLSAPRIRAALDLTRALVPVFPEDLDKDPWLLNTMTGTIDLRDGSVRTHRREDMLTKLAPTIFDPHATAPVWEAFLDRIFAGNTEIISYVRRAAGYSLTASTREQCLFVLHGSGANGKSTFLGAIRRTVGSDYSDEMAPSLLMSHDSEHHPTEIADLHGLRFVTTIEVRETRRLAEDLVKQLTGGDRLKARRMREDFWSFEPTHKVWLAANHKPEIKGTDLAIWRRLRLIPFIITIPEAERDPNLSQKLALETSGILAWAVRGASEWHRLGRLVEPPDVLVATAEYRSEMDTTAEWLRERCDLVEGLRTAAGELYKDYRAWSESRGERPTWQRTFKRRLEEHGYGSIRDDGARYDGCKVYPGIGLKHPPIETRGLYRQDIGDGP